MANQMTALEGRSQARADRCLAAVGAAMACLWGAPTAARPLPAAARQQSPLSAADRRAAGALMRVNHVGEVCAQALYAAQALTASGEAVRHFYQQAALEEGDHLAWTRARLSALGAHRSHLNLFWYGGAFALGVAAGLLGDRVSLGFMVETERQVEQHLASHLERLPSGDAASRAVVAQMQADEQHHAEAAAALGAVPLPAPVRGAMRAAARVMTTVAYWV